MKISALLLATAAAVFSAGDGAAADLSVKVLSFNIRYGTAADGANAWPHRQEMVFEVIRTQQPDFCGLQEALRFQIDAIRKAVPEYAEYGCGRDDGKTQGEYSAILYREDRWKPDRGETLWLSDTPEQPGSASWGNTIPRIVTWGRFVDKQTGRALCVFNTHFDHQSQPSRVKSAEFLAKLIARQGRDTPMILTGDFNAGERNPAIEHLKRPDENASARLVDTFRALHPEAESVGTFNGFEGRTDGEKIDYIFADPSVRVTSAEILRTHRDSRYPSDHFPVNAEVVFPDQ
ncbi:MAG: endonuclease/exonuclease/phosphatase family protein [Pirellulales bacterium]|nr:endonuclease/exonuclease/phosphatase family protein [Pirellulales bacterium]